MHSVRMNAHPRRSITELAEDSGLMDLSPSDLVCEASCDGITYYDYVLSSAPTGSTSDDGYTLYMAKFDNSTNLESLESVHVPAQLFKEGLPESDLSLILLAVLTWKNQIAKSRVLCLVRGMGPDSVQALEAIKRATGKFKCLHHVQTTRRGSMCSDSSRSSRCSEGMRLRVMLCQTRCELDALPAQAVRETKCLLVPSSNPLLCLCFPIM